MFGSLRSGAPVMRTCVPAANIVSLQPERRSTVAERISQRHSVISPFGPATFTYSQECGLTKASFATAPLISTSLLRSKLAMP
ncbi:hypothetical protein D3C83_110130 [compost metagenome]